ncbi:hypothetical protein STENM327S_00510 [Streptomyces tendae]
MLLTLALIVRKTPGAILISIVVMTVVAVIINAVTDIPSWGLTTPEWPGNPVATPDFGLVGEVSLFGGFDKVGVLTGLLFVVHGAAVVLLRRDGHDHGRQRRGEADRRRGPDAGHQQGPVRRRCRRRRGRCQLRLRHHLFVESAAGVGEGARTGFANIVTGALFALALFLAGRHHGPVPGGDPGADRGRLPDPGRFDPGDRLVGLHDRHPGLRDDAAHAVHLLDRQRRRHGLPPPYVAGRPELIWTITLVGFIGTFGFNFPVFLSAFADDVFDAGAGAYSLFNTLMAVGSLAGALLAARRGTARLRVLIAAALGFGALEIVASAAPELWLFALLMVPIGVFSMTVNVTANTSIQMSTDPAMRGRVMALYMMVFLGGSPVGAPIVGWVTDTYGARVGFAAGGAVAATAALVIGLVLARVGNLRLSVGWHRGHPQVRFVPRERQEALAPAA